MCICKKIGIMLIVTLVVSLHPYTVFANPYVFNLEQGVQGPTTKYSNYRKTKGLLQAYLYHLSVVPKGILVDNYLTEEDITAIKEEIGDFFMCRPDAPVCEWQGLPRSRELRIEDINSFLTECRKIKPKAVLLCYYHASLYFTGKIIERFNTKGAINVIIDWGKSVDFDYVGPGFDGGELTRGRNSSHSHIHIPWYLTDWPAHFIWNKINVCNISQIDYKNSRKRRIDSLAEISYEKDVMEKKIPLSPGTIDVELFCEIYEKCVRNVIKYPENFNPKNPIMIQIGLYTGNQMHVSEIWDSKT